MNHLHFISDNEGIQAAKDLEWSREKLPTAEVEEIEEPENILPPRKKKWQRVSKHIFL